MEIPAAQYIGYAICIACLVQLFIIFFIERKNIIKDLRGKDLTWQFLELSGIVWLVMFPATGACALMGVNVPTGWWASLDALYFMNVGSKMGHKWLDNKKPKEGE